MNARSVQEIRRARPAQDGDGVAIKRVTGMRHTAMDPFLMLDELHAQRREDLGGGFPPHPHRGMQTLTYMKHGGIIHEDSRGNRGEIRDGGVQWMSAGRGIIHSEMPTADTEGLHGFQLWVNLPAAEKLKEPRYRDIPASALTWVEGDGYAAAVIAGEWRLGEWVGHGPLRELAPRAALVDLTLHPQALLDLPVPPRDTLLAYVYAGSLEQPAQSITAGELAVTTHGNRWSLRAGSAGVSLLLLRGEPVAEPVAQYGPFVMNTQAELEQAIRDYQSGEFG